RQAAPAPQTPDMMQTASTRPAGGGIGDFLGSLLAPKATQKNRTVQLLMEDGLDEGTATLVANDKGSLQTYLRQRAFGEGPQQSEFDLRYQAAVDAGLQPGTPEFQRFYLTGDMDGGSAQQLINVGKGRLYDPNTKQFITAPDMGTDAPTVQTFYDDKTGQPYNAQWNEQTRAWERVGGAKAPSGGISVTSPDGTVMTVGGAGQKVTEGQSKDIYYYTNGSNSNAVLSTLDTQLTDWTQANADKIPLGLGNYVREPSFRQAHQAGRQFLSAILRKESGGAITSEEWESYGPMFLPVPGDDPATIEQKRNARSVALDAIKSGLGTAEAIAEANKVRMGIADAPIPATERDRRAPSRQPVVIDGYTIEEVE
ncbi:MAG TPA: hypothetical protein VGD23_12620, partial [Sphingomicrobium sp.]